MENGAYFGEVVFTGGHEQTIVAVNNGDVDGGVTWADGLGNWEDGYNSGALRKAVDAGLVWLAVAGVIASVIGAYYYLRIVYFMYFGEPREGLDGRMSIIQFLGLTISAVVMIAGIVNLFGIDHLAANAAQALVR